MTIRLDLISPDKCSVTGPCLHGAESEGRSGGIGFVAASAELSEKSFLRTSEAGARRAVDVGSLSWRCSASRLMVNHTRQRTTSGGTCVIVVQTQTTQSGNSMVEGASRSILVGITLKPSYTMWDHDQIKATPLNAVMETWGTPRRTATGPRSPSRIGTEIGGSVT